ncbi:hypothetical protein LJR225_002754 [Phenylobacterium sp. LjRoot225]|uniref:hypothetical protein n=1 Tax=Phenylobacterium sp. LjRoot225 TaxID=3342285 RepID=UPI003ECDFAA8
MPGLEETMLCYSLKPKDLGWAWCVVDADGETVASGFAADRDAAGSDVRAAYNAAAARQLAELPLAA